jgi:hypothetical protein
MPRLHLLVALLLLILVAGCSDKGTDPPVPDPFAVTVEVVDGDGEPVAGLRGSLSPDIDHVNWPHGDRNAKPSVLIRYTIPRAGTVGLVISDVSGATVWSHEYADVPAGSHDLPWTGQADDGGPLHDGYYLATLSIAYEDGSAAPAPSTRPILLITGSPEAFTAGTTDAGGRFTVTDRTYVPGFWDLPPLPSTDEQGQVVDDVEITTATRLVLLDDAGNAQTHLFEAVDGPQTLRVTWEH